MKLRTCEFCGTEYDTSLEKCPLCGKSTDQAQSEPIVVAEKKNHTGKGGARLAKKAEEDKVPRGMWIAICSVLGLAVLIGLLFFLYIMGLFGNFNAAPVNQEPDVLPEYNYEEQLPETSETEETAEEEQETVDPNACTGLSISKEKETLAEPGDKFFLTAVAKPSSCTEPITFSSSDESIATVNVNGMVTAIGPGEAEIYVTCGEITESCLVICDFENPEEEPEEAPEEDPEEDPAEEPEEVIPPTLSTEDFTLRYPGEKAQLSVNNAPEGAAISYVSGNTSVVTVTASGEVTAVADGNTTITVTVGDTVLSCIARVNLESSAEGGANGDYTGPFKLSHTDVTLFSSGESFTLTLVDATGKTVPVGWFASNGCVSIIGNTMKAVAGGQCTVTCVYNGVTYNCIIRCNF